MARITDTVTV